VNISDIKYSDEINSADVLNKRVIKKTRGAAMQRNVGDSPWYAINKTRGTLMNNQPRNNLIDYFNPNPQTPADKGFADETPYIPDNGIDLNSQLQNMFKITIRSRRK
jgi:hypothetical protein